MKLNHVLLNFKHFFTRKKKLYKPVPELNLTIGHGQVQLRTPWITLDLKVSPHAIDQFQSLKRYQSHSNIQEISSVPIQTSLKKLLPYSLVIQDNSKSECSVFTIELKELHAHIKTCLQSFTQDTSFATPELNFDKQFLALESLNPILLNHKQTLPMFYLIKYLRLKAFNLFDPTKQLYQRLAQLKDTDFPRFKRALALCLKQNYVVTALCNDCLLPATRFSGQTGLLVENFRQSELNHDRLLKKSLSALDIHDPNEVETLPETFAMMAILKHTAQNNAFAFALTVEAFEGGIENSGSLLITKILQDDSRLADVKKGIASHHHINQSQGHQQIGYELCQSLAKLNQVQVEQAVINVLALSLCQQKMAYELLQRF